MSRIDATIYFISFICAPQTEKIQIFYSKHIRTKKKDYLFIYCSSEANSNFQIRLQKQGGQYIYEIKASSMADELLIR